MYLIAGLGNPGKKFEKTRHNVGFMISDKLQETSDTFSNWKLEKKFQAKISKGEISSKEVILAKPQTFMNESGKAIKTLNTKYLPDRQAGKIQNTNLFIVHDDIDLPLGKIKIVKNHGSAGHKGVESIIKELGTKDFIRFRVGIKPEKIENRTQKTEKFVLKKFTKEEEKILKEVVDKIVQAIETAITEGIDKTMGRYNQ
jgi:PTH1 family peptidyl-tRNA hydrolase